MSDLIIVDEADRVQMQLDAVFAPSATLVGESPDSWLDEVQAHKITELARQGRLQLSAQEIDDWTNAVNTVYVAADRLYALLIQNKPLRNWVVADYFSPFTLHQRLLSSWFPQIKEAEEEGRAGEPEITALSAERDRVSAVLDAVRDDPLQPREDSTSTTRDQRRRPGAAHPGAAARARGHDHPRAAAPRAAGPAARGVPARGRGGPGRARAAVRVHPDPRRDAPPARLRDRHVARRGSGAQPRLHLQRPVPPPAPGLRAVHPRVPDGQRPRLPVPAPRGRPERVAALLPLQRRRPRAAPRPARPCPASTAGPARTCC